MAPDAARWEQGEYLPRNPAGLARIKRHVAIRTRSKNSVYAYAYQGERARSVPLPRDEGDYPQQRNLHGEHFDISVQSYSALNVGN